MERNPKRQRVRTGDDGRLVNEDVYQDIRTNGENGDEVTFASYAEVLNRMETLSESEKIDFLLGKYSSLENMMRGIQVSLSAQSDVQKTVELLALKVAYLEEKSTLSELRVVDLEARSRRHNLVFFGIPEASHEDENAITETMFHFFGGKLGMSNHQIEQIRFQRVHRLGRPQHHGRGGGPRGPARPRPIIVCFRDYPVRQEVLNRSKYLRGTGFSIAEDFPTEIRDARGELWNEFRVARQNNLRPKLIYPAKLLVGNEIVKDKFPDWGKWSISKRQSNPGRPPRSGAPIEVSMASLINTPAFRPQHRGTHAGGAAPEHTAPTSSTGASGGNIQAMRTQPPPVDNSVQLRSPAPATMQVPPPVSMQGPPPATIQLPPPATIQLPPQATIHLPTSGSNSNAAHSVLSNPAFQSGLHDVNVNLSQAAYVHAAPIHRTPEAVSTGQMVYQTDTDPHSYGARRQQSFSYVSQPQPSVPHMHYPQQHDFIGFDGHSNNFQHTSEHGRNLFSIPEGTISNALNVVNI